MCTYIQWKDKRYLLRDLQGDTLPLCLIIAVGDGDVAWLQLGTTLA